MVHTGKGPACIAFLKLSDRNGSFLTVGFICAAIKSGHLVVDPPLIIDGQIKRAGQGIGKVDLEFLFFRIYLKGTWDVFVIHLKFTAPDSQFQDVQHHLFHRLPGSKLNNNLSGKSKMNKVGFQTKRVTDGVDNIHGHLQKETFWIIGKWFWAAVHKVYSPMNTCVF